MKKSRQTNFIFCFILFTIVRVSSAHSQGKPDEGLQGQQSVESENQPAPSALLPSIESRDQSDPPATAPPSAEIESKEYPRQESEVRDFLNSTSSKDAVPADTGVVELLSSPPGLPLAPVKDATTVPDTASISPSPPLPLIPSASFFTRYELREGQRRITVPNVRFQEMDAVAYRARFGLATTKVEVVDCLQAAIQFTPQASGFWEAGGLNDASLGLHEGYLDLTSCNFGIELGRMEMFYGDHLVIGNVGWHQTGRSFDGIRLHIGLDPKDPWVDLLFTAVAEGLNDFVPTIGAGDKYLTGIYTGIGSLLASHTDLDFYALVHILPKTQIVADTLENGAGQIGRASLDLTLGSRLKFKYSLVDMRLEAGIQTGRRPAVPSTAGDTNPSLAFQIDGELGLNLLGDRFRIAAGGLYASGDDPDTQDKIEGWDQLYPTAHKWLGFSDIIGGRSNVAGPLIHLSYITLWNVIFALDGHMFFRPQDSLITSSDGSLSRVNNGHAGDETDVSITYLVGTGLKLRSMYALFLPDSEIYPNDYPVHYFEIELRYDLNPSSS